MMGIPPQQIANFDEMNVYFALDFVSTIEMKGKRTVTVHKPYSSSWYTAMIGVTMDGIKFPPHVIFKGKLDMKNGKIAKEVRNPKRYGYVPTILYSVQEKACMDEKHMVQFIQWIWEPFVNDFPPTCKFMILLDESPTRRQRFKGPLQIYELLLSTFWADIQATCRWWMSQLTSPSKMAFRRMLVSG